MLTSPGSVSEPVGSTASGTAATCARRSELRAIRICVLYAYDQTHPKADVSTPVRVRRALREQIRQVGRAACLDRLAYDFGHYPETTGTRFLAAVQAIDATFPVDNAGAPMPRAVPAPRQQFEETAR